MALRWSNPLWSALNLSLATEEAQILDLAHLFAISLPTYNVSWGKLDPAHLDLLAPGVLALGKYRSRIRWWYFWSIYAISLTVSWGSMGLFAGLCLRLLRNGWVQHLWSMLVHVTEKLKQGFQSSKQSVLRWWDSGFELVPQE